ncbi:MAG TPA: amidase, partial [Gammaproteobacteria bacterium]|nr:amidase [Gammaproteobacteria bacterium]
MTEIFELSLTQLDRGLRKHDFSLVEVVESLARRIEDREAETRAFTSLDLDRVRAQLDQVPSQSRETAICGIPFGVKDIFNTSDWVTAYGSDIYEGHQPVSDAAIVSQLRSAGGVVMGKTVTTEFAYFSPGKTRNPKDLEHTPGGSSQGSAAAVADRMIPFALGSQTAASVIRPAAFCGVIGYKASVGEFPLNGVLTLSYSMDSLGFFVRDLEDLQLLRRILLKQGSSPAPVKPRRVGLVATPPWSALDKASQSVIEEVIKNLGAAGVEVGEVEVDGYQDIDLIKAHKTVMA